MAQQYLVTGVEGPTEWSGQYGPIRKQSRWSVDPETGCWNWLLHRIPTGYGQVRVRGRAHLAHRFNWEMANGPVPDGLELDHLCRNRGCVNPAHLEVVTHHENLRRACRTKLTDEAARQILASDKSHAELAREYGVDPSHIGKIRRRGSWSRAEVAA